MSHPPRLLRAVVLRRVATAAALSLALVGLVPAPAALAAPGLAVSKSAAGEVLAGEPITYTLTATNDGSGAAEFNGSFRDELAPGLTYVPGSTTPEDLGDPIVATDASTGQQTLTWADVDDVLPGSSVTITFQVQPDPAVYPAGSVVANSGEVYTSEDPFVSPEFDADGNVVGGTSDATAASPSTATTVTGLVISKGEPSPEGELLRGVHDNVTEYTVTVRSAPAAGSENVVVVDHLPANLEYLGCDGGPDNTTGGEEYPGSGPLVPPALSPCVEPDSVTTVIDPSGLPGGVYTRVEWQIPAIDAGTELELHYAAGVPLRENVLWTADPAPESTANLDNNTGPSTRETDAEATATNLVSVEGDYLGDVAPGGATRLGDTATETVTVEDVRMRKTVEPEDFTAGEIGTYTIVIDSSEYVSADPIVVEDVVPDGLCPLGDAGTNYAGGVADCEGAATTAPSTPYDSVEQNADGTFDVSFAPTTLAENDTLTITYQVRMLPAYLGTGVPTAAGDSFTNSVELTATTTPVAGTGESGEQQVADESEVTMAASGLTLTKTMLGRADSGGVCSTDLGDYAEPDDVDADQREFRLGDRICYGLRVQFSDEAQTRNAELADLFPAGQSYVAGSATPGDGNTVVDYSETAAPDGSKVVFLVGEERDGARFVDRGAVFEIVLQAEVTTPAPGPGTLDAPNLLKGRSEATDGTSTTIRDKAVVQIDPVPPVGVVKGVEAVDDPATGPNGPGSDVDGSEVAAGSVVTFRVDVTHEGVSGGPDGYPVGAFSVWDVLETGIRCVDVSNVVPDPTIAGTPTVTCTDPGDSAHPDFAGSDSWSLLRVEYPVDPSSPADQLVEPGETVTTLYDVTIPDDAGAGQRYDDTAYVGSFVSETNVDDSLEVLYPQENVDLSVEEGDQTAPSASDGSNVVVPGVEVEKSATTSIEETNNDLPSQATVGEEVTYAYRAVVPANTTVYEADLQDTLPSGLVPTGDATLAFFPDADGDATAPVPAPVTIDPATGTVDFGDAYQNATDADQAFEVTVTVLVTDEALTASQNGVPVTNTARFRSLETAGGAALPAVTDDAQVELRQPRPTVEKSNSSLGPVPGGEELTFTVVAGNDATSANGVPRPPLHDGFVVDCLPAELIFVAFLDPAGTASPGDGANGCPVGTTRLVWSVGTIEPGAAVELSYTAVLTDDAVAGATYTNTVAFSAGTLDDGKSDPFAPDNPDERTATVTDTSSVTVAGAGITKTVSPSQATIGERFTWRVTVEVPPNTSYYDAAIVDQIPAGIDQIELVRALCTEIGPDGITFCDLRGTPLPSVENADGSTTAAWSFGDVLGSAAERRITVVYRGRLADEDGLSAGDQVVNDASTAWNLDADDPDPVDANGPFTETGQTATATASVVEPEMSITKSVSNTAPDPTEEFTYTLTLSNADGPTVSDAHSGTVVDTVPDGVVVDPASITAGGELTGADPVNGGGTITWTPSDLAGPLGPGQTADLQYTAVLAPSVTLTGDALTNEAALESYFSLGIEDEGGRQYVGPTTDADVAPDFPELDVAKSPVSESPAYIGEPFTWSVTVTNVGDATAFGVDAEDTIPSGWDFVEGSLQLTVDDGAYLGDVEPDFDGDTVRYEDVATLPPGTSVTATYELVPTPDVVPNVGSDVPQVNTVAVTGEDESGAPGNAVGPYEADASGETYIASADLVATKTHDEPVVAGEPLTWTVEVSNAGPDTAVGPFTVLDSLPDEVETAAATGDGWTCQTDLTTEPASILCDRDVPGELLAVGESLPPLTVETDVPADVVEGTDLVNEVFVDSRTYDPEEENNTATDVATVSAVADLEIDKAHAGDLTAGTLGTWTVDVTNLGPSDSQPVIVVEDTLPAGVTFDSATGDGWECSGTGRDVRCERDSVLPAASVAPQITVVGQIDEAATGSLENTATVTPTTSDPDGTNNTATDTADLLTSADLVIEKSHEGSFVAGSQGTYTFTVVNAGPSTAAAPVTVTDTLPDGLQYSASGGGEGSWTCSSSPGTDGLDEVECVLDGDLPVGAEVSVDVTVDVDPDLGAGEFVNSATVDSSTPDPNEVNNTDVDDTQYDSEADLAVVKSHEGDAVAGTELTWTVQVENRGPSSTEGPLTVADALPDGVTLVSAGGPGWGCDENPEAFVTCTSDESLAAGSDDSPTLAEPIEITVLVLPDAGPSTLENRASVDGVLPDPDVTNNTDLDPVTVIDVTDLSLSKSVDGPDEVVAGTRVTYELEVSNLGPSDADTVLVADYLPIGMTPVSATGEGWRCVTTGRSFVCRTDTIAAPVPPADPSSTTIEVVASVDSAIPAGTSLVNTAGVQTATSEDDLTNNDDDASVTVVASADLSLVKSHDVALDPAVAGTEASFTIDVANAGPSDAQGPVTVTDTLPDGLSFVGATGPWACAASADGAEVTCVLDDDAGVVAGGSAPTLEVVVAVADDAEPGDYVNTATVTSETADLDESDNTDTDTVPVERRADLSISKTHDGEARVGDELTFEVLVANAGPSVAQDVTVSDPLPTGASFVAAEGEGWECAEVEGTVDCSYVGSGDGALLDPGATAPPIVVTVVLDAEAYPELVNVATAATVTPELDLDDNTASDTVDVPPEVDLAVAKSHDADFVVGEQGAWMITVTNLGPTPDPGPVVVTDTLPDGVQLVSAEGDTVACEADGQVVSCAVDGELAVDDVATITLVVEVLPDAYPSVTNGVTVESPSEDVDLSNNSATDDAPVVPRSVLDISKIVVGEPDEQATFSIVVTNEGPNATTAPVVVTDTMPDGLALVSASGEGWECGTGGATATCTYADPLDVGDRTPPITVVAVVEASAGAEVTNVAAATGGEPDGACPDCDPVTDDATFTVPIPGEQLPVTGAEVLQLALLALLLLAAGAATVATTRSRPSSR
ncbi:isopeptide-forming domain-containing fimbrial protein [Paraoerskovia marina]|uniref:isopeptide-forming domain-containing fimbrial protein n=1 Tax=Paraoerskovia marina TaxID=545619 RepID=UPI0009F22579|nr:isopeptide-forming domain-containing fimbrial protein [Paraoerskovia marina]